MTLIPPPIRTPIQSGASMPPVWQRWFLDIYARMGGARSVTVVEIETILAAASDDAASRSEVAELRDRLDTYTDDPRPAELAELAARLAEHDELFAAGALSDLSAALARIADLEAQLAALPSASQIAALAARLDDLERLIQS